MTAIKQTKLYTCIGKGGEYARIGTSLGAGECRGEIIEVYRDTATGQLYHRETGDFFHRMEPVAHSAEPVQGEAVEVVGFVTLGGVFHGGSGPELGEIDIEPDMGVLERLQYKIVTGSDDVYLDLMTVAQHNRIMAAAKPDTELVQCLKFARATMATVAENANLRGVEHRSLMSEVKRIDAKLAELQS